MDNRRGNAEYLYGGHRTKVRARLTSFMHPIDPLAYASPINHLAIEAWKQTWKPLHGGPRPCGDWDWCALQSQYAREPKRLDIAIWSEVTLCALIIGKLSNGRKRVNLEFIESYAGDHPLKGYILDLADIAGTAFAYEIDISRVAIVQPAQGLIGAYEAMGYRVVEKTAPPCMEKGV